MQSSVVCLVIYRPGSDIDTFLSEFTAILETVAAYNCNVVITGDFNIHVDDASDRGARRFLDLLESFGLSQFVTGPTHKQGHTLDLVITRSDLPPPEISVEPPLISDHSVVNFLVPLQRPPPRMVDVSTRAWKGFDKENFRKDLLNSRLCMTQNYQNLSVDDLQRTYDSVLASLLDKHAPAHSVRRHYQPMTPWFDSDCVAARRRTRALERRYRRTKLPDVRLAWTKQVRDLHRLYAAKQNSFWKAKVKDSHSNSKKNFGRHYSMYSAKINPERQFRPTVG